MPFWLLEYLLTNKVPTIPTVKVSFILLPYPSTSPHEEQLPELLNTYALYSSDVTVTKFDCVCYASSQSKLTASRFLRVRKLTQHVRMYQFCLVMILSDMSSIQVQDKLERITAGSRAATAANTPRSSFDARSMSSVGRPREGDTRPRPEDQFEILCHDAVLPLDMTLAAVRQYIWRQSGELIMYYRRKHPTNSSPTKSP